MRLRTRIAAVELDGDEVRLAVVKTGGNAPGILELRAARVPSAAPGQQAEALADAVRRLFSQLKHRPAAAVLCVPSGICMVRPLTVPFKGASRVAGAVPFELEPHLAVPLDDLVIDFVPIREIDGETEVLTAAVRRSLLEERLDVLAAAGIEAEGIAIDAAGLTALWQARQRNPQGLNAVLHARQGGFILAITFGRALAYFRPLQVPVNQLDDDPAAVAREVLNSTRAFLASWRGARTLNGLTITGIDMAPAAITAFQEGLGIPVQCANLIEMLRGGHLAKAVSVDVSALPGGEDLQEPAAQEQTCVPASAWPALVGAAMAAAGGTYSFNLRQGGLAPAGLGPGFVRHLVFTGCIALLVALGVFAYYYVDHRQNKAEVARLGAAAWELFSKTFPNSPRAAEGRHPNDHGGKWSVEYMREEVGKLGEQGTALPVDVLQRTSILDVLRAISEAMPDGGVTVTEVQVYESTGKSQRVIIGGEFKDDASFNGAFARLKESGVLTVDEEPIKSTKQDPKTSAVKSVFTIEART